MDALGIHLELARPAWLAILVALGPILWRDHRAGLANDSPARRRGYLALRAAAIVLLALALAGPTLTVPSTRQCVVLALDESDSIDPRSRQAARQFLAEAIASAGDDRVLLLPFATTTRWSASLGETFGGDRQGTDLAGAIRTACAGIPRDWVPKVVLLTDGDQTVGDALEAARLAGASGVPVWTVPLDPIESPEVFVSQVRTRTVIRQGEPFAIEVVVWSNHEDEGTVRLAEDAQPVVQQSLRVVPGANRVRLEHRLSHRGLVAISVAAEGFQDTIVRNNKARAMIYVAPPPKVLWLRSRPSVGREFRQILQSEQIEVEQGDVSLLPRSADAMDAYDLVILDNVPAEAISPTETVMLKNFVAEGGGLLVSGGDRSFTAGGYRHSSLEEILPVLSQTDHRPDRPPMAMVLVVDRSYSMRTGGALELAKEATCRAIELLDAADQVGVLAFDESTMWISPLATCSDKAAVLGRVERIALGSGTEMYPAMDKAYLALRAAMAGRKHILLLTDGVSNPEDFRTLVRQIARSGVTISTVALGREASRPMLEEIARLGHGQAYVCENAAKIPEVFVHETVRAMRTGLFEKPSPVALRQTHPLLAAVDLARMPSLLGYVETQARPEGSVVLASPRGDPLLAWWRCGMGVSMAFASELEGPWAAAWLRWTEFPRFWTALVRHAVRSNPSGGFSLRIERRIGQARLVLDCVDRRGRRLDQADVTVRIAGPNNTRSVCKMPRIAPGQHALEFDVREPGIYRMEVEARHEGRSVYVAQRGLAVDFPEEYRLRNADHELLRAVAQVSGGAYHPQAAELFAPDDRTAPRAVVLWPWFVLAAAVVFVLEIAFRRGLGVTAAN